MNSLAWVTLFRNIWIPFLVMMLNFVCYLDSIKHSGSTVQAAHPFPSLSCEYKYEKIFLNLLLHQKSNRWEQILCKHGCAFVRRNIVSGVLVGIKFTRFSFLLLQITLCHSIKERLLATYSVSCSKSERNSWVISWAISCMYGNKDLTKKISFYEGVEKFHGTS